MDNLLIFSYVMVSGMVIGFLVLVWEVFKEIRSWWWMRQARKGKCRHDWGWRRCCWPYVEGRGWAAYCQRCKTVYPVSDNKRWNNPMPRKPRMEANRYMLKETHAR